MEKFDYYAVENNTGTEQPRHNGYAECIKRNCEFSDCSCFKIHLRSAECNRDHKHECPTCKNIPLSQYTTKMTKIFKQQ